MPVKAEKQARQAARKEQRKLGLVSGMESATAQVMDGAMLPIGTAKEPKLRGTKMAFVESAHGFQSALETIYSSTAGKEANAVKRMQLLVALVANTPKETIDDGTNAKDLGLKRNTDAYVRNSETRTIIKCLRDVPKAADELCAPSVIVTVGKGDDAETIETTRWMHRITLARELHSAWRAKRDAREMAGEAYALALENVGTDASPETKAAAADAELVKLQETKAAEDAESSGPEATADSWAKACLNNPKRGLTFARDFLAHLPQAIVRAEAKQQEKIRAKLLAEAGTVTK